MKDSMRRGVIGVLMGAALLFAGCAPEMVRPTDLEQPAVSDAAEVTDVTEVTVVREATEPEVATEGDGREAGPEDPSLPGAAASPEEAARSFYTWYIAYTDLREGKSVVADKAYVDHPLLTSQLADSVEETIASFEGGGYDPFLCAQDVPTAVSVGEARIYEDQAWVRAYTTFPGHSLDLTLVKSGDLWRIDEIACHAPADASSRTSEQVVESFYEWYIHYPGNPMADRSYFGFGLYLTQDLIEEIDEIIASFEGGGYDPFLCAQDVPTGVSVSVAEISGDEATLTAYTTFPGHSLDLTLVKSGDLWRIDEIGCRMPDHATRTPEQVVESFYEWYIHYPGNPMADKSYYGFGLYLTQDLIEEIDAIIAGFEMGGYVPFLLAQDLPQEITVDQVQIGEDEAMVRVDTNWEGHTLMLRLVREGSLWKIAGIARAE